MSIVSVYQFTCQQFDDGEMPFDPDQYSLLKFGCDDTARQFGNDLANTFFAQCSAALLARPSVVIPSPYNFVPNAATIMTRHFVDRLNHLLVEAQGEHVDYSIIHRKVSYTHDYGFMSREQRRELISHDLFYLNEEFYLGKNLIFVDDIRITGTHEERLADIIASKPQLDEQEVFYLYYGVMTGPCRPDIEAALNFSSISTMEDYVALSRTPNHHVIVRPIKFLLGRATEEFDDFLNMAEESKLREIYQGCLGEGYYRIPEYQTNFLALRQALYG